MRTINTQMRQLLVLITLFCVVTGGGIRRKKQLGTGTGITFAIPGLNFLGGGLGNNGGNVFGGTFTRTIVSTVSTVTTASFRTCTMPVAALMPCVGTGRRRREAMNLGFNYENEVFMDHEANDLRIEPTASIALIIGTTTLTDPVAVSEYLVSHQPSSQSIIYPQDISISEIHELEREQHQASPSPAGVTELYPSNDLPEQESVDDITTFGVFDDPEPTTETPLFDSEGETEGTTPQGGLDDGIEVARVGFGQTTVTTVIRVTSVATTLASGMMATLTVAYMGCLPPSLPVSGIPC